MVDTDIGEAAALSGRRDPEEPIRAIQLLLCEVLQMDRLFDQVGIVYLKVRPGRDALRVPALGLLAVFETENLARTLQGELTFADQEQQ